MSVLKLIYVFLLPIFCFGQEIIIEETFEYSDGDLPANWWTSGVFPDTPKGIFAAFGFNNKCIVFHEWDMVTVRLGLDGNIENKYRNNFIKIVGEAF